MVNLEEYNKLNWCDLTLEQKQKYIQLYFEKYTSQNTLRLPKSELIKIKVNSFNGIKSNYVAREIKHNYIHNKCLTCGNQFELNHSQIMKLRKDITKPIFCSKQCASTYTTKQWHIQKEANNDFKWKQKVSNTLKLREKTLSDDEKAAKYNTLNFYWKDLTQKQRSEKAVKAATKNHINGISKIEYEVKELLDMHHIIYKHQYYINGLVFDFAIYKDNLLTLVELNGQYWHNKRPFKNTQEDILEYNKLLKMSVQRQQIARKWRYIDVEKVNYCIENNINYITIYFDRNSAQEVYNNIMLNINNGYINIQLNDVGIG